MNALKIQSGGFLSLIFVLGSLGTGTELILLDHTEDFWQLSPLILVGLSLVSFSICLFADAKISWTIFRGLMVLSIASGLIGFWMHYETNVEFEKEMYPSLEGFALFFESMKGATPSLAPGAMIMVGFIGLLRSSNEYLSIFKK